LKLLLSTLYKYIESMKFNSEKQQIFLFQNFHPLRILSVRLPCFNFDLQISRDAVYLIGIFEVVNLAESAKQIDT